MAAEEGQLQLCRQSRGPGALLSAAAAACGRQASPALLCYRVCALLAVRKAIGSCSCLYVRPITCIYFKLALARLLMRTIMMLAFDALRDGVGKIQHAANMNVNAEQ